MNPVENSTELREFVLVGLTKAPELQVPLFVLFTLLYLTTLIGNLGMIGLILVDSRLHTPMYFFLSNLSLADFAYSSAVTPKVMAGFLVEDNIISYNACAIQMFFFVVFATSENFLLTSMAYDRYAAVCKPLHYSTIMTSSVSIRMALGSFACGVLNACFHVGDVFSLSLCRSRMIQHFFCDVPAILALSCSEKLISELFLVSLTTFNVVFALLIISVSYLFIFMTILKVRSGQGYQKALSTCASHLTAVSIFYGTVIFMYLQPSSSHSMDTDKVASVFYSIVIPMLNPVVYSLRNKEVKNAFKKVVDIGGIQLQVDKFTMKNRRPTRRGQNVLEVGRGLRGSSTVSLVEHLYSTVQLRFSSPNVNVILGPPAGASLPVLVVCGFVA
ncbi:PREDICTED: olfactory receptor 5B2-like [Elephantulus edwardii]|uniref:olfactory receptor 5B2-like n=1 Tax=Elephantulus edwardii TaxID=28737 RepID=UPI0003F0B212|nr:PREDICTED: olfactory receptor 5B2-like [Elephantulus edwardii]